VLVRIPKEIQPPPIAAPRPGRKFAEATLEPAELQDLADCLGDILKAVFPPYMSFMDLGEFTWDGMVENMAKKAGNKKVSEMMTTRVITVPEDAPLMECVDHMVKNNVKRLPVIGKDGKVIGTLYERDVFFAITKAMLDEDTGGVK
jgi:hypothetical protein